MQARSVVSSSPKNVKAAKRQEADGFKLLLNVKFSQRAVTEQINMQQDIKTTLMHTARNLRLFSLECDQTINIGNTT